ncbi:prolactin-inducible protein homolog [Octodon degus]|uniref:Prolactin-inducible protein homolog n=1 Tax=Octodon degus TaxID=10160 RepID=A0A6P3V9Z1_OCTDE|nr:prolactin-inducible protein homolog [Octodon degus]
MCPLQLLFQASPAALLLLLCLQLGISTAQEDTRKALIVNMEMPKTARAGEVVSLKLKVQTELRECMVIKAYILTSKPMKGPFNYTYTACLCEDYPRTFFWDIQTNSTLLVAAGVGITQEKNICPNDDAVIPIKGGQVSKISTLFIKYNIMSVAISTVEKDPNEYSVTLTVTNNMDKPMVVSEEFGGSTEIVGTAEVVSDENICPPGEEQYAAVGYQVSTALSIY